MNVVVTGATKGIGRAICELLATHHNNLAICSRTEEDLISFQKKLQQVNGHIDVIYKACDVGKKNEVRTFGEFVLKKWKTVDVLINNAGIFIPGAVLKEKDGALENMIETNLYSAYHLTRVMAPVMIDQRAGHIINICSIASKIAYPNGGSYSISKFALLGFSKVLREELKEYGIRVTSILPGATWSNSWKGADFPEERLMNAEDIAQVLWSAISLSKRAVVEEIIIRPQLGDL